MSFSRYLGSKMTIFTQAITEKLAFFTPYLQQKVAISSELFQRNEGIIAEFVAEIQQTAQQLSQQTEESYSEFYAQKLIRQFDLLKRAAEQAVKNRQKSASFQSHYRFPKNVHNLPENRRLQEYKKALRILNEKLSWLTEQSYRSEGEQKAFYIAQMQETEYRKQKCLRAIGEIE